jgi:hypothetical protein
MDENKSLSGKYLGGLEIRPPGSEVVPPRSCVLQSISAEAAVYLKVLGKINLVDEINKQQQMLEDAKAKVQKSQTIMSEKGQEKANEATKRKEREKLEDAKSEVERIEEALEILKLEGQAINVPVEPESPKPNRPDTHFWV